MTSALRLLENDKNGRANVKLNRLSGSKINDLPMTRGDFETIASLLYKASGIRLTDKKEHLVYSRLSKRLRARNLSSFEEYCRLLKKETEEEELLLVIQALTTNVTKFFREPHHFELLRNSVLPALTEKAKRGDPIRIWSAGCSAGQEPYTIAMEILEWMPNADQLDVKILATDIDKTMVDTGRRGVYPDSEVQSIAPNLRNKHFQTGEGGDQWQVSQAMQKLVSFRVLNLFDPWPMRRTFHAIFCRNVVIYFDMDDQAILWEKFAKHMSKDALLMIGHSERISGRATPLFEPAGVTSFRLKGP